MAVSSTAVVARDTNCIEVVKASANIPVLGALFVTHADTRLVTKVVSVYMHGEESIA